MTASARPTKKLVLKCIGYTYAIHFIFIFVHYAISLYKDSKAHLSYMDTVTYLLMNAVILIDELGALAAVVALGIILRKKNKEALASDSSRRAIISWCALAGLVVATILHYTWIVDRVIWDLEIWLGWFYIDADTPQIIHILWSHLFYSHILSHMLLCLAIVFVSRQSIPGIFRKKSTPDA